jgi:hypothetical protein
MKILCQTGRGGAVTLNEGHGVSCSYAVATVGDSEPPELLYTFARLRDGRSVQFFLNRETGLVVLDLIDRDSRRGKGTDALPRLQVGIEAGCGA